LRGFDLVFAGCLFVNTRWLDADLLWRHGGVSFRVASAVTVPYQAELETGRS
jgi:hypothetical protein